MKSLHAAVLAIALVPAFALSLPVFSTPAALQSSTSTVSGKRESPFACDRMALSPEDRRRHFDELGPALRSIRKSIRELPDGYEFEYPADAASIKLVAEWAAGERVCCPFFDIDLRMEREGGSLWLRLSGRDGVKQFIKADFSPWFK
jgi:hypothetical protein